MKYVVAFYESGLGFGGPEEGGWHYDTGTLVRLYRIYANANAAWRVANRANRLLDRLQAKKTPVHSAIYPGGRHRAHVFERIPPEFFPETPPTYS